MMKEIYRVAFKTMGGEQMELVIKADENTPPESVAEQLQEVIGFLTEDVSTVHDGDFDDLIEHHNSGLPLCFEEIDVDGVPCMRISVGPSKNSQETFRRHMRRAMHLYYPERNREAMHGDV